MKIAVTPPLARYISEAGFSLDEILHSLNISHDDEHCGVIELQPEQYYRLIDILFSSMTDDQLAAFFDISKTHAPSPIAYAALCCENGYAALRKLAKYNQLFDAVQLDLVEDNDQVFVLMRPIIPGYHLLRPLLLGQQLLITSILHAGSGKQIRPLHIQSAWSYGDLFADYFSGTPCSNRLNELVFAKSDLEKPFITYNPLMLEFLEAEFSRRIHLIENEVAFVNLVKEQLHIYIPRGDYSIEKIANNLGVSVRSLQRSLSKNNLTYKKLVSIVQADLTKIYILDKNLSTEDISLLVGYQNISSFLRAFKKWTGMTVSQYRQYCNGKLFLSDHEHNPQP